MSNRISENTHLMRAIVALDQAQFEVCAITWRDDEENQIEIQVKPKANGTNNREPPPPPDVGGIQK